MHTHVSCPFHLDVFRNLQSALLPVQISLSFEDLLIVVVAYFFLIYFFFINFFIWSLFDSLLSSSLFYFSCLVSGYIRMCVGPCPFGSLCLTTFWFYLVYFWLYWPLACLCTFNSLIPLFWFFFFYEIYFCVTCSAHKCTAGLLFPLSS